MKIGIVTYWWATDNYGQLLQCYALQHYLRSKGHDAFLIRYQPEANHPWKGAVKKLVKRGLAVVWPAMKAKYQKQVAQEQAKYKVAQMNLARDFDGFRAQYLHRTDRIYYTAKELQKNPPVADCYIVGSDQVWSRGLYNNEIPAWYLQFGKPEARRIAYAASRGKGLDADEVERFGQLIRHFDAVAVREESLLKDCHRYGLNDVKVTLDPTLLLDKEYYPIAPEPVSGKYMFLYVLNVRSSAEFCWPQISSFLQTKGLQPRVVYSSGCVLASELIDGCKGELLPIPNWLSTIRDAQCVMTTSFHGIVFSIILHKPFLAIPLRNEWASSNCRVTDLLDKLGLSARVYNPDKDLEKQMQCPIDWEEVDRKLALLREGSVAFLDTFISSK